jgi:1-phosphofructokinase family hexose kinase
MFICVSPNPAIDKRLTLESLKPGRIHRVRTVQPFPGGKAAHVAMVLRTLGAVPHWTGFCGGPTGDELIRGLAALGITVHPCPMRRPTRTNLEIIEDSGTVTEILEPGSAPSRSELSALTKMCSRLFSSRARQVSAIFSGSLPAGVPAGLYARLIKLAHKSGAQTFLDASGAALRAGISARPDFVKVNRDEAAELLRITIDSMPSAVKAVGALLKRGARSAALTLGAEGLLFRHSESSDVLLAEAPRLTARSSVGSGDSALAGIAYALGSGARAEDALRLGVACGAANCLAQHPGGARLADINRLKTDTRVRKLA